MQTFGDGVGVPKVTITQRTQQMCVEILDIHHFHACFGSLASDGFYGPKIFFLTKKIYLQSIIDYGLFNDIIIHTIAAMEAREIE